MIDERIEILAERINAGIKVTPSMMQRQAHISKSEATQLIIEAIAYAEEIRYVRRSTKQAQINAKRQAERRSNRSANRKSGSYRRFL